MCILHCRTHHSTSYMYMYICTAVLFSVVSCRVLCQLLWTVPAAAVPANVSYRYFTSFDKAPTGTCSFDKAASTKAASTKLYQLLTSGCQLVSSGCQLVSSGCQLTVQRMSANFQNKAVSKYFWNMYQLMSAAVHVLRYVLSSGYQMRALHEFTNVSGS